MTNSQEDFNNFGYDSDDGCDVCGEKPAKVEPRFSYKVCIKHIHIPPTEIHNKSPK